MKKSSVYPILLILLAFTLLFTAACNRKSGCHALDQSTKPPKKAKRGDQADLFGRKQ
jgi:hypothetical protein